MSHDQKKRDFFPKKEVQQQLDDLWNSGQDLFYEKQVPLTPQDIVLIKRLFFKITLFFIVLSIPVVLVIYNFRKEEVVLVVGGAIVLFFIFAIVKAANQLGSNLRVGTKTMVRGIITDRFTKEEYGAADEDGKRSVMIRNYLQVGNREFKVNNLMYRDYKIGEAIEFHFIISQQNKPYFLHHVKLKEAGLRPDA